MRGERGKSAACTIASMPNLAVALKTEIARVARKEIRAESLPLKKAVGTYRSEIASLKRRMQALEGQLRRVGRSTAIEKSADEAKDAEAKYRFQAKGLLSQRRRLGLSAAECGLLLGVSTQSIYNWEAGKAKPRVVQLPAIAGLKALGRKTAAARLASLKN